MIESTRQDLIQIQAQVSQHLFRGIIPFWLNRGVDQDFGGYLTCFDGDGKPDLRDTDKYIVTQTPHDLGHVAFFLPFPWGDCLPSGSAAGRRFLHPTFLGCALRWLVLEG